METGNQKSKIKNQKPIKLLIFLLILLCHISIFTTLATGADVRAFVDQTTVVLGESLQLTVAISRGNGEVDVSPIKDFKIKYDSPRIAKSVQIVNDNMFTEVSYNYTLIPLYDGTLKIPPLQVKADGNVYQTKEIIIQVSRTSQKSSGADQNVFIENQISNHTPYVGEQIVYTLRLCNSVQIQNARFQNPPEFPEFTAKKIEKDRSYRATIKGREYHITELTYVLIPMNAGEKIIAPVIVGCEVIKRSSRRRGFDPFFNDPFFGRHELESKTLMTEPMAINVKPLPDYDSDIPFSGLVGSFDIQADLESTTLKVGDSTTLSVAIKGTGNIMDAAEPLVHVPEAFKVYKDNPEEDIRMNRKGHSGKKVFRLAIVPVKAGEYSIPPIHLSYFNVADAQYETLTTSAISLTVNPSKEKEELEVVSGQPENGKLFRKKVEFTGRDILPLKEDLDALDDQKSLSVNHFTVYLFIPMFFYLLIRTLMMFSQKDDSPASVMAERAAKALKDACKLDASGEEFLSCLYRALISAILSNAGIKGESLTYAEAEQILRSNDYPEEMATQAAALLEKIESAKFSGLSMDTDFRKELLAETREMVRHLS